MATPHLVPLTVADPVTARILAAHLGAEGVVWEIRGNVGSPYPVGPVELLVDRDSLDLARELLAETELPPDADVPSDAAQAADTDPLVDMGLDDTDPPADPEVSADGEPWAHAGPAHPAMSADAEPPDDPTPTADAERLADTELRRPTPPAKLEAPFEAGRAEHPDTVPPSGPADGRASARGRSWLAAAVVLALLLIVVVRILTAAL